MERETRRVLIGESVGHAVHDAWYGVAPVLMAALSAKVNLSNSDIAFALLLYQVVSSATQPLFGRLSDRWGGRLFAVSAIVWTTIMFTTVILAPSKLILTLCVAGAGLGSGAWHPQGTVNSTLAGGRRWGATSAAVFFFGGMLGSSVIGAALGGFLIDRFGQRSLLAVSALTLFLGLTVVRQLVPRKMAVQDAEHVRAQSVENGARSRAFWVVVAVLLAGIALRSLAHFTLNTFVPKYQQDLGASPAVYGLLMSAFLLGNGIGGVVGSYVADRIGIRNVLVGTLLLGGAFFYAFLNTTGMVSYMALALGGFFLGPSHTLFVVSGQRLFPGRMATASGLFLGFIFVSGSGGAWVLGMLADRMGGLAAVLGVTPWVMLGAAMAALIAVPSPRPQVAAIDVEPVS